MSTKLWCVVCQTTHSHLWMASDLVLPSTQWTVLDRLKGLELQLQAHCILCTACYSLVEHWDKQIAAAAKTEQLLKGLITPVHLHGGPESGDTALIRKQGKGSDSSPTIFLDSFSSKVVETPGVAAKVSTNGLTAAEVAVADCLVTAFGKTHSETSHRTSTDSDAAEANLADTAVVEVNLADPDAFKVNEAGPALTAVSGTDTAVLEVGLSVPVLKEPATHTDEADVDLTVTDSVVDGSASGPDVSEVGAADLTVSGECSADSVRPDSDRTLSKLAPPTAAGSPPPADAPELAVARHHCHICGKGFARNGSLNDHLAAHAGTKAYACSECGLRFQYRDGLLVHRRRHHGGGRLACPHCSVHFDKSCNLRRHLRVHTGERPFGCSFCPKRFAQSNGLKKHVRGLHADRVVPNPG